MKNTRLFYPFKDKKKGYLLRILFDPHPITGIDNLHQRLAQAFEIIIDTLRVF
jgi:hypothetical protein